ncbi:DEAD/DEAH box helicase [Priestia megaterium]|uniref:DEAD/DEAH box helicase n=1 Tax=Priestia megaterium TaxID=1404 RepID=A0A6H1P4K0_PRIMG|nr:DEAD/DEAH box helicase [Priestia megaterium]QIZ08473.1 DEAD/DEAH box helicase [Priestia megaterium]
MAGIFKFFKKDETIQIPQIIIKKNKTRNGLEFYIQKENETDFLTFPLQLSILEIKQQKNIELLEALEELWYEEFLEVSVQGYLLSYRKFYELPVEIKSILQIPDEVDLDLRLSHVGAIGTSNFKFILEKDYQNWINIQSTSTQIGPWITLADGTEFLMNKNHYEFEQLVNQVPDPRDRNQIFPFVARVRKEAKVRNIPLNTYLEKQEYLFVDQLDIDVTYEESEISLQPKYKQSNLEIDHSVLDYMSNNTAAYYSDSIGKKYFVSQEIHHEANQLSQIPPIRGQQIPKFVENPEAFLPETNSIDMSVFSERVKSLGIQVYRAQPYVHASEKERGWFELNIGLTAVDEHGETQHQFSDMEMETLINRARDNGEEFIEWNGNWLKIPEKADEFLEASKKVNEQFDDKKGLEFSNLPYILEIYENINHLEFNQPLLEVQKTIDDLGVIKPETPPQLLATLKPFQTEGYVWMKLLHFRRLGGLLADDMGLGKTVQVITFLTYLYQTKQLTPVLIVAPKTLIDNWQNELEKFAPSLLSSFYIHRGSNRLKNPEVIKQYGITITTYQTLVKDQFIFGQIDWNAVICDEAQAIKNPSTSASKVLKAMKSRFRIAMTGTPVENGLSELWSIMDFVQPGLLGSLSQFKQEFINKLETNSEKEVELNLIAKISKVYKRRTKSEELGDQLPPKNLITKEVSMGKIQAKLYEEVISLVRNKMIDGLEAIQKLKALSSHPALINEAYLDLPTAQVPKLMETLKMIEDIKQKNEKVLIFTEYIKMQTILRNAIRDQFNINPNIINGMTNRRLDVVNWFNSKEGFDVLILSPKAAGTGLTITSANHVIHYTRWWNPAVENQATDRVYRIGQEKPVYVYYPIVSDKQKRTSNGTVEEIVHKILSEKQELASNVITTSKKMNIEEEVFNFYLH